MNIKDYTMENDDWLKSVRDKLEDYGEPSPDGLWEDIESSLPPVRRDAVILRPLVWRSAAAAAAAVALGVFAGLRVFDSGRVEPHDSQQGILASGQRSSVISDGGPDSSADVVEPSGEPVLLADNRVPRRPVQTGTARNGNPGEAATYSESSESQIHAEPSVVDTEEKVVVTEPEKPAKKALPSVTGYENEDWSDYLSASNDGRKTAGGTAVLDVSFSGAPAGFSNEDLYDLRMFDHGPGPESSNGLITDGCDFTVGDPRFQTRALATANVRDEAPTAVSRSDHKRPVRLALTASYPVCKNLSVETGLAYTTLRSTFSNELGGTVTQTEQTLRYLGVPLNVSASVYGLKLFSLYLSGGGMAEKCLSGKSVTTDRLYGERQGDDARKNLDVKPLLWSLNASAGLQVNLSGHAGLYVEPGVSYHFDDGSDVQTIYKERPLDFILTFGVRFSLK